MEGYSMFEDRHVLDIKVSKCETGAGEKLEKYFAIMSKVKPRTKDKDPVTKRPFYTSWIISTSAEDFQGGNIFSAYCSCKGAADGSCRHIIATLFEIVDFLNDRSKASVTSGECQWVRRANEKDTPILVTELNTSMEGTFNPNSEKPTEDMYNPIDREHVPLPNPADFIRNLKRDHPEACLLHAVEIRSRKAAKISSKKLTIPSPFEKTEIFFKDHINCQCNDDCILSFQVLLEYTDKERDKIENETRGQNENENWHRMRKGFLTASNFKNIIHSTDHLKSAHNLLKGSTLDEDNLPLPIVYGRKNEAKARDMFARNHRYTHKKCTLLTPGLVISKSNCFLAASPDGIIKCDRCGTFLIEIKCFWKYKGFHPKNALLMSKVCTKKENNELVVDKNHKFYYQVQGQMLCTEIYKCVLIAYTNRGIHAVDVPFDDQFCQVNEPKLSRFYVNAFYPALKEHITVSNVPQQDIN